MKKNKDTIHIIITYLIGLIVCATVSFTIDSLSLTLDEAFSVVLVRGNLTEIIKGTAADVHPPLYYLLLKLSSLIGGESILKYRIVTAVGFYLNILLLGATKIRKRWGFQTAIWYILWFGGAYYSFYVLMQVRMYTWGTFFATYAALALYEYAFESKKNRLVVSVIFTICAMYTHYYSLFVVFFAWLYYLGYTFVNMIKTKKSKPFLETLVCGVIITASFVPWLTTMFSQSGTDKSMFSFYWHECLMSPAIIMQNSIRGFGLMLFILSLMIVISAFRKRKSVIFPGFLVFFGTMTLGAVYSLAVSPIWAPRYLYMAFGVFSLVIAVCIGDLKKKDFLYNVTRIALLCVLFINIVFSVDYMRRDEVFLRKGYEWVDFTKENISENDLCLLGCLDEHWLTFEAYIPGTKKVCFDTTEEGEDVLVNYISSDYDNKWLIIDSCMIVTDMDKLEEVVRDNGYKLEYNDTYLIRGKILKVYKIL